MQNCKPRQGAILLGFAAFAALMVPQTHADLFISSQTSASDGFVLRYEAASGSFVSVFASGGGLADPLGCTFGPSGDLYVCSGNSGQVLRYDGRTGAVLGVFASGGGLVAPINLTFGPDGNLYVSSSFDKVIRYNGQTGAFLDVFISDSRLAFPRGLTFGPAGNLYVVSYNNAAVLRYNGTTGAFIDTFVASRSGGLATPSSLVFGPDRELYVAGGDFPNTGVFRYDGSTGAFIDQFVVTGDDFPIDLAFGPDGNLYVLTSGNVQGVSRFDGLTGSFIDNFVPSGSGGLVNPYALAFSPPPAPRLQIRCSQVELCWETVSNAVYQLAYRSSLTTNRWVELGDPVKGDGTRKCVTDIVPEGQPQRLYHLVAHP